jgi:hypothetical protein
MMAPPNHDLAQLHSLRAEIAAKAARMIAEDGADYAGAKRRALRMVLGNAELQPASNLLPDNAEVEAAVRKYQALFQADSQPQKLRALRLLAVEVMQQLEQFRPYLTGAALNGTAGAHDDVHLQLFADSAKDVIMFFLDRDVNIEISETPHFKGGRHAPTETVSFHWRKQQVHAELYEMNDLRGAPKPRPDGRVHRADINAVRALLDATADNPGIA